MQYGFRYNLIININVHICNINLLISIVKFYIIKSLTFYDFECSKVKLVRVF